MTTLTPVDPVEKILNWARPILSTKLPGWSIRQRLAPGATPSKTILVKHGGGTQASQVADRARIILQSWADDGVTDEYDRVHALRVIVAEAKRALRARVEGAYVPLPDPTNPERSITQITITALFRGEDQ